MRSWIIGVVGAVCLGMAGCASCTRVGPGYAGIKVNMAGSERGVSEYASTTGWVFYNPFSTTVLEYPTFVQIAKWQKAGEDGVNEEITFNAKTKERVDVDVSVGYHLNFKCIPEFYVQFRNDDIKGFTHGFMRNIAKDRFVEIGGTYSIDQIMGDNAEFLLKTKHAVEEALKPYCVSIDQLGLLGAPRPPPTVIESINATAQATQKALQIQNEVAQAEAEARKNVANAEGFAKSGLIQAEAQARANRMLSESLTPTLVELKRIEKWDGKLPQVSGGATPLMSLDHATK